MSVSTPQAGAFRVRTGRGIGGVLAALGLAALVGGGVALAFSAAARPSTSLAAAAGVAGLAALSLAFARYEAAAALGMLMLGVVFVEPAPPDALLMTVIAVAIATGRFTLRRVPAPVLLLLAAFLLLNLISTVFANEPRRAATYLLITTYLCLLGIWVSGFVDSPRRARVIIAPLIAGAVITAAIGVAVLFVSFPGRSILDFSDGFRARGFFKDPNVFGPFCAFAALFVVSELLEPRLLRAHRPLKLFCLVVLALGTLFAYSRAAWLNAAVATMTMIVAYVLRRGGGRKAAAMLVTLVVLAGVGSVTLAATGSVTFLDSRAHLQKYDTDRFSAQEQGLKLAQHYPLGIGPGQFEHRVGIASHNTYVRVLAEQGTLGLFVMLAILLTSLGLATRNVVLGRDTFGVASVPLLAALCGILANSAFVDTLHWRHTWLVLGLIWAGAMRPAAADSPL
jgi:O-antigen ligase